MEASDRQASNQSSAVVDRAGDQGMTVVTVLNIRELGHSFGVAGIRSSVAELIPNEHPDNRGRIHSPAAAWEPGLEVASHGLVEA